MFHNLDATLLDTIHSILLTAVGPRRTEHLFVGLIASWSCYSSTIIDFLFKTKNKTALDVVALFTTLMCENKLYIPSDLRLGIGMDLFLQDLNQQIPKLRQEILLPRKPQEFLEIFGLCLRIISNLVKLNYIHSIPLPNIQGFVDSIQVYKNYCFNKPITNSFENKIAKFVDSGIFAAYVVSKVTTQFKLPPVLQPSRPPNCKCSSGIANCHKCTPSLVLTPKKLVAQCFIDKRKVDVDSIDGFIKYTGMGSIGNLKGDIDGVDLEQLAFNVVKGCVGGWGGLGVELRD